MSIDKVDLIPVDMSIDSEGNTFHAVESEDGTVHISESPKQRSPQTHERSREDQAASLKSLYEQLQNELKDREKRLENANYRIGQLEAHIKESIPLLEYKRDLAAEQAEKDRLRKDLDAHAMELGVALNNFREEKFNKRIYLILLFILLLLQPLWFLFPPK
jgi:flagellar motility protein MotE (MotC chaperone)